MSDDKKPDDADSTAAEHDAGAEAEDKAADAADQAEESQAKPKQDGPTFTEAPSPLEGVSKATRNVWDSMEGKTVSLRIYVGSIIGVILLMLLSRCGG